MIKTIGFVSLGCDKNRVDLEKMMYRLHSANFELVEDLNDANIILINTCAFILKARVEAVNTILEIVSKKGISNLEKVVVTGCLPERYYDELKDAIPEIDAVVKLADNDKIEEIIWNLYNVQFPKTKDNLSLNRILSNANHYAFIKIADGCNNCCSYCTIPRIRGRYQSSKIEDVVEEAKLLAQKGVKELILVAQDTTRYGIDLYGKPMLVELLKQLANISDIKRIRIHYCYPEMISDELLNYIDSEEKICPYLDIPLQHFDDAILKSMNRKSSEHQIIELITKIRSLNRKVAIRSTFIIGYPGETRKQFKKLCDFLKQYKLDNVGFFIYSREEKTSASYLKNQIPIFIKKLRLHKIQKIQEKISIQNAKKKIGEIHNVIIDRFDYNNGKYYGRDEYNSVDIDYEIEINQNNLILGNFYNVKIIAFENNIFKGEIV